LTYSAYMDGDPAPRPSAREIRTLVDVLTTIPLFRILGEETIVATARAGLARHYRPGQFVFHQGDPGDRLYAVIEGLVKVVSATGRGDEIVVNTIGRAETFGEMALLDGSPRSASIVAVAPTRLFSLSRDQIMALIREHPALMDEFLRLLGRLVRGLTERAVDSAFLDLGGRLAKLLLQLAGGYGGTNGTVLVRGLTQSDLATLVGASRPAVNRALRSLAARDLIEIKGRSIVLRDIDGLRRRCGR
jgi:CRP/FNR family cyclic AMP-dependent transcriptional regulator